MDRLRVYKVITINNNNILVVTLNTELQSPVYNKDLKIEEEVAVSILIYDNGNNISEEDLFFTDGCLTAYLSIKDIKKKETIRDIDKQIVKTNLDIIGGGMGLSQKVIDLEENNTYIMIVLSYIHRYKKDNIIDMTPESLKSFNTKIRSNTQNYKDAIDSLVKNNILIPLRIKNRYKINTDEIVF